MSNNGPKFKPIKFYTPPPSEYYNALKEDLIEWFDEPWCNRPQDEVPVLDMEAYAEANYHFTLTAFEALLAKHGLKKLLKDMSRDSALAIITYDAHDDFWEKVNE